MIEIEPNQPNLDEDMQLLALSGLVPIDCLIKRMNNLSKWLIKDEQLLNAIYKSKSTSSFDSERDYE